MMINHSPEPWTIAQPGGPIGPVYGVVASNGNVIAMYIPDLKTAVLIQSIPHLLKVLQAADNVNNFINEFETLNGIGEILQTLDILLTNKESQILFGDLSYEQ